MASLPRPRGRLQSHAEAKLVAELRGFRARLRATPIPRSTPAWRLCREQRTIPRPGHNLDFAASGNFEDEHRGVSFDKREELFEMLLSRVQVRLATPTLDLKNLLRIAPTLFGNPEPHGSVRVQSGDKYLDEIVKFSVFAFRPSSNTFADFLWLNEQTFEVVVRAVRISDVVDATEFVVRTLRKRLSRAIYGTSFELTVLVCSVRDGNVYIRAAPVRKLRTAFAAIRRDLVYILIAAILVPVAHRWLEQYKDESIAVLASATILALVNGVIELWILRGRLLTWTVNHED